jgi:hypothetical protein
LDLLGDAGSTTRNMSETNTSETNTYKTLSYIMAIMFAKTSPLSTYVIVWAVHACSRSY